ncbi:MAG: mandelate racemase/muconate lactonizing enzyme family protein [Candidatus Puniceispirillaceae bacterium]
MKITRITVWDRPLTSLATYYMADGKTCDTVSSIVIKVDTDQGISGWGEVCPIPHYLPAYSDGVLPALEYMAPVLIGADPLGAAALHQKMSQFLIGHPYAKSPVDIACWDITAKAANMPLYQLLGGLQQKTMPVYHSLTCIEPDEMARMAKEAHSQGVTQFQVKLGADRNNEADIARLSKVREVVSKGHLVYGDWNCGASTLDATRVGRAVRHLDIMLEQPCATIEECADVRRATGLAMKLDENAHDTASLLAGAAAGCMDAVALKLSKFGGLTPMMRARDLCMHLGAKMCIEDTWGSDITTSAAFHLGASTPMRHILNVCDLVSYTTPRLWPDGPVRKDGHFSVPEGVGLGVEIDPDSLGTPIGILD